MTGALAMAQRLTLAALPLALRFPDLAVFVMASIGLTTAALAAAGRV